MISVIVPVYNVKPQFLIECVRSIMAQTYHDLDIVLVDDGSSNGCQMTCDELGQCDDRIQVIHQSNQGEVRARARGVEQSRGEWITFVDADDTLPEDALSSLYDCACASNCAIAVGNLDRVIPALMSEAHMLSPDEYREAIILNKVAVSVCAKLFKRSLFDNTSFDIPREIKRGPDKIMHLRLAFTNLQEVTLLPKVVYRYRANEESVMSTFHSTLQHKALFFRSLWASVPQKQQAKYLPLFVKAGFATLREAIDSNAAQVVRGYMLREDLRDFVEKAHIPLSQVEHIYIYASNERMVRGVRTCERLLEKVRRHLPLNR